MYGTKTDILLERILKNVGVFSTSPHFYNVEFNPYTTKTERLLYLIEINTRILAYIVPPGGNAGDVLTKSSNSDYDSEWSSIASILGYTPADDSLVVHLAGSETITGTKTFTTNQIIDTSSTSAALRVTQTGTGEAIRVEDSANPDTSPFVVASDGKVGIGTATPSYFLEALSSGGTDAVIMFDGGTSANANLVARADTSIKVPSVVITDRTNAYSVVSSFYIGLDRSPSSLFAGRNDAIYVNNYTNKGHYFITANASGVKAIRMSITPSGQVSIGNSSPNSSAVFQVDSTTQGILIPRVTTTQKNAISTPATSLMVYDTDLNSFYYYTGTAWAALGGGAGTLPTGGTAGQILAKNSATDYDTLWIDNYADWTSQLKHEVKLGEAIAKGQAVYVSSADGTNMVVSKADNSTEATSSKTMGLLETGGSTNAKVKVITEGLLSGLDTSTASAAGDPVWLGTSGNLIYGLANKPYAPSHLVFIGIVTRKNNSNGEIFVKIQNGFELKELHDVQAQSPSNNNTLYYDSADSQWKTASITTILGYTPYNSTNPSGYIDSSALSPYLTSATAASTYQPIGTYATASNSMAFTNKSGNISQWTNDSAYITNSALSSYLTSATAASTYQTILSAASASVNGYLSSTDWSTFNGKQNTITLTTTGTSGAATLVGNTLNIPQYSAAGQSVNILNNILAQALTGAASPTTRYHAVSGTISSLTTAYQIPLATACTFGNFYFRIYSAQPASGSLVLTLQKNAADTTSTITIAAGSAIGNYTDNTNTVSFSAGDTWQIKIVQNATSGSTNLGGYSFKLTGV